MQLNTIKQCEYCNEDFPYKGRGQRWCSPCCQSVPEHLRRRKTVDGRMSALVSNAKARAKKKDLPFDLTVGYMVNVWKYQDGKCPLSGRGFGLDQTAKFRQVHPDAPSIDRIEPSKGYVEGNVRLLTYHTNVCVNEYGDEILFDLIEDIQRRRR